MDYKTVVIMEHDPSIRKLHSLNLRGSGFKPSDIHFPESIKDAKKTLDNLESQGISYRLISGEDVSKGRDSECTFPLFLDALGSGNRATLYSNHFLEGLGGWFNYLVNEEGLDYALKSPSHFEDEEAFKRDILKGYS